MVKRRTLATRGPHERIIEIDRRIRRNQYPSVSRLAQALGVTQRTVYRDLDYMRNVMGYPIKFSKKNRGYYYEGSAPTLGSVVLNEGELFALFVGRKVLAQYRGTPYENALRSAFEKIRAALTDDVELYLDEWERKLSFDVGGVMDVDPEIFAKLQEAVDCGFRIRMFYYTAYRDERTWREIDPYFLFNIDGEWYLVGFCHLRKQLRTFMPGRIEEIELTDKVFKPPAELTLTDFLRDAFRVEVRVGQVPQNVRVRFSPEQARYIRERRWHSSQAIEEQPDGSVILNLTVVGEKELIRWVLRYGADAEILEPAALRDKVKEITGRMVSIYSGES